MAKSLVFNKLSRELAVGGREELELQAGLNLIVGPPNTGKSVWLQMLNYLMGDRGRPEEAFKADLAEKYVGIAADAVVDGKPIHFERSWASGSLKTKIRINGNTLDSDAFSDDLLEILGIPVLHYPSGNPYSEQSWRRLSWRTLLRHIYRQERFWGDIADKQPESEQHAALTLFLGIAEGLFPPEWEELIQKRRDLQRLEARRDQFQETVDQIARDLIPEESELQYLTAMSVTERINDLERRVNDLLQQREATLEDAAQNVTEQPASDTTFLTSKRAALVADLERVEEQKRLLQHRYDEVSRLLVVIRREIDRLARVVAAGDVLADLKITHCPACDQAVTPQSTDDKTCFFVSPNDRSDSGRWPCEL